MLKLRLRNDISEISEKNSSKKWFPTQLNSVAKNSRTDLFQESLALNFKWNTLTARISWQRMHSKLVDIFSHFSQLYHSCVLHRSWWISASSWLLPTLIWLTLAHTGSDWKSRIFCVVVFSRETLQTLAWQFLLCFLLKVFRVYMTAIYVTFWRPKLRGQFSENLLL